MSLFLSLVIHSLISSAPASRAEELTLDREPAAAVKAKGFTVKIRTGTHDVSFVLKSDPGKNWLLEKHDSKAQSGFADILRPDAAKLSAQFQFAAAGKNPPATACPNNQVTFSGTKKTKNVCVNRLNNAQTKFISILNSKFPRAR